MYEKELLIKGYGMNRYVIIKKEDDYYIIMWSIQGICLNICFEVIDNSVFIWKKWFVDIDIKNKLIGMDRYDEEKVKKVLDEIY